MRNFGDTGVDKGVVDIEPYQTGELLAREGQVRLERADQMRDCDVEQVGRIRVIISHVHCYGVMRWVVAFEKV
jgi:hypothetical protein